MRRFRRGRGRFRRRGARRGRHRGFRRLRIGHRM